MTFKKQKKGVVLIICMIFLCVFSVMAVSLAQMAGSNIKSAENYCQSNRALESAQSGLEVVKFWLANRTISGNISPSQRFDAIVADIQNELESLGATNYVLNYDSVSNILTVDQINLDSQKNRAFSITISQIDDDHLQADIIGTSKQFSRKIRVNFQFSTTGHSVFDFGVATKGPLAMSGQAELEGATVDVEASVYIEGNGASGDAFSIVNHASVAGDVSIANPYATYTVGSNSSVGGATGEDVHDHVFVGVDYVDFPVPNPDYFNVYATGEVINSSSDWDSFTSLNNITIAAGTNPTFASNITINGILFIESPNTVTFTGKAVVNGIVVGDGELDDSSYGSISFAGQVICNDTDVLTGEQFEAIKQETGTFIVAPGFYLDFSGQDLNMHGAIAGSGISFSGQAGGLVNGSVINYSTQPMLMSGQSSLTFNRSGTVADPAGFVPEHKLLFEVDSYSELPL